MKQLKLKQQQGGFTLIELLIVMVVIGLLALLVVNQFGSARDDADDTQVKSDVTQLSQKIELFYTENGRYPADTEFTAADLDVKAETLVDPDGATYTYTATAAGGGVCDAAGTDCEEYTVSGTLSDGTTFSKTHN